MLLDCLDANGSVGIAAGEHDAGSKVTEIGGEGAEENIDGLASAAGAGRFANAQPAVLNSEDRIGR